MRKLLVLILPVALTPAGCLTQALERYTVNQSTTATDYRYRAALHCLATVASKPDTLPSYALLSNGTTSLSETGIVSPLLAWAGVPEHYASTGLGFTASRSPMILWTVSPVADDTQLEAMRCACRYVLDGATNVSPDCISILTDPEGTVLPGPHFGVLDRLNRLPSCWLHRGRFCDVPAGACYKDHCGDTWVWVMSDGMEGLSGFTLVLQDIATLLVAPTDGTLPQYKTPPLLVTLWVVDNTMPRLSIVPIDANNPPKSTQVVVGQSVSFQNNTAKPFAVTSTKDSLFTVKVPPGPSMSKAIAIDDAMYKAAGGSGLNEVEITYTSKEVSGTPKDAVIKAPVITDESNLRRLILKPDPYRSIYSQTLITRVDRVIDPQFKYEIEKKIKEALSEVSASSGNAGVAVKPVDIKWEDWLTWTKPYQGQRTSAKPGTAQQTPVVQPARLLPPAAMLDNLRLRVEPALQNWHPYDLTPIFTPKKQ